MPCPCFQPLRIASDPQNANARLPLWDEYDGYCHASGPTFDVPAALRFRNCNHGNSEGSCPHFPSGQIPSALRYAITAQNEKALTVLCMEESNYAPIAWSEVQYRIRSSELQPSVDDPCRRAQLLAFCQGYLRRIAVQQNPIG